MTDEHVPPTDEELDNWENLSIGLRPIMSLYDVVRGGTPISETIDRLIAEVRRLRELGRRFAWEEENPSDRTLTLPNGTVVRAGDVLVLLSEGNGQHNVMVIRVAGFKENLLVARIIAEGQDVGSPPDWFKLRFRDGREIEFRGDADWRPWSEMYPDRPVPIEAKVDGGNLTREKGQVPGPLTGSIAKNKVLAWLGYWRDKMQPDAVADLQDLIGVPGAKADRPVPGGE